MAHSLPKLVSSLSLAVAAVMLAGCGHSANVSAGAAAPGKDTGPVGAADIRACSGVQAIIGHLSAGTARWSPNLAPFDKAIASQIRLQSQNLARQAPQAQDRHLRAVVQSNAGAFSAMADAMAGKDRAKVDRSIAATRVAYRELKKVCPAK